MSDIEAHIAELKKIAVAAADGSAQDQLQLKIATIALDLLAGFLADIRAIAESRAGG